MFAAACTLNDVINSGKYETRQIVYYLLDYLIGKLIIDVL